MPKLEKLNLVMNGYAFWKRQNYNYRGTGRYSAPLAIIKHVPHRLNWYHPHPHVWIGTEWIWNPHPHAFPGCLKGDIKMYMIIWRTSTAHPHTPTHLYQGPHQSTQNHPSLYPRDPQKSKPFDPPYYVRACVHVPRCTICQNPLHRHQRTIPLIFHLH